MLACSPRRETASATRDDLGRDVALPQRIEHVVTLAPNLTEIVFALGAGSKIAGTDDYSNFPAAARALPKVGGMQPNVERIAALKPDVVLASTEGNPPALASALQAAGIPLYVVRTDRLAEVPVAMRRLGELLGAKETEAVVRAIESRIAAQKRTRTNAQRVMFAVWTDPLYVAGTETFTGDLFQLTGARNVVQVRGWPQYSLESFAAAPPDILLYPRGAVSPAQIQVLLDRAGVKPRVVAVDEDIFQRPGPRVAEAAEKLNAILSR